MSSSGAVDAPVCARARPSSAAFVAVASSRAGPAATGSRRSARDRPSTGRALRLGACRRRPGGGGGGGSCHVPDAVGCHASRWSMQRMVGGQAMDEAASLFLPVGTDRRQSGPASTTECRGGIDPPIDPVRCCHIVPSSTAPTSDRGRLYLLGRHTCRQRPAVDAARARRSVAAGRVSGPHQATTTFARVRLRARPTRARTPRGSRVRVRSAVSLKARSPRGPVGMFRTESAFRSRGR